MQAKITQSFLAALSLLGILALPSAASAHDEDPYNHQRKAHHKFHHTPYANTEHLQLQRSLRHPHQDRHDRYSYTDDDADDRWHNRHRNKGNFSYQGKHCPLPRQSYTNGKQYRPRYYGNDYYGYAR